jgi:hypothetical protein
MLEKGRLRKVDTFMGILFCAIGAAIVLEAMSFPTGKALSGVRNDWYVAPALVPYIIGGGLVAMGFALFVVGLKHTGAQETFAGLEAILGSLLRARSLSPSNLRFVAVVGVIAVSVFLYIPKVDFVVSATLFLVALMSMFSFDDDILLKRLVLVFAALGALFFLYVASGLDARLGEGFYFAPDVAGGIVLAAYLVIAGALSGKARMPRFLKLVALSLIVPLILVPVFKYLLYIPLPREGGIVALMDYVRFDILDPLQE